MNAVEYTRKLRRVAAVSWVGSLLALLALAWLEVIPLNEYLPFLALLIGAIPIALFLRGNKAACESCGGRMKICSGYPRIVYQCRGCGKELDTGIYSDY
jgi:hypothetical protein